MPGSGMLAGKVAIVTGIGPGMGRSIALLFAEHGADVVLGARSKDYLAKVADEVSAFGRESLSVPTDISDPAQCDRLVDATLERFGGVDVFVQNGHHAGDWKAVTDAEPADWRQIMEVNFWGAFTIARRVIPSMTERGGGRIVLVNSGAALRNPPTMGAYSASKSALGEPGPHPRGRGRPLRDPGEQPHAGAGGRARTSSRSSTTTSTAPKRSGCSRRRAAALPLGHIPTPDECAGSVLFLASPLSAAVTGQDLVVNGGQWVTV